MIVIGHPATAGMSLRHAMGESAAVRSIVEQVEQVAASRLTVLIHGETGTGKELVARAIHERGSARTAPFVDVDCGALPDALVHAELFGHERGAFTGADGRRDGFFQLADGGTLFLDEVANLSLATQAALLRVLQERQIRAIGASKATSVDVGIIAATNIDLRDAVERKEFREDLYYRLSEFTIALPPLRQRAQDIPHLVQRCLEEIAMELGRAVPVVSHEAMTRLRTHAWPGNVRQLRNVVRQAVVRSAGIIIPEHLRLEAAPVAREACARGETTVGTAEPAPGHEPPAGTGELRRSLREVASHAVAEAEQQAIHDALRACAGNKSRAAVLLNTDYKTLHTKMRTYGITVRKVLS